MSSARDDVLANIRRSLGVSGTEAPRAAAVAARLSDRPRGIVPARGQLPESERITLFKTMAERASATVSLVANAAAVPEEVARFLRDNNLPATLRRGDDPRLAGLPWDTTTLDVAIGRSHGDDLNAISQAFGAIAESGTLALISGPDNPTSLNFLPDNHIVVLAAEDLAGDFETVLARLPTKRGGAGMPRSLNFITGPSRSGDIEQKLILGAHGPRRLHIIITAADAASA